MLTNTYRPYSNGSSCKQQVANLQRTELADVSDDFINLKQHVCCVSALYCLSVNVQMKMQILYVWQFLGWNKVA